eukprot:2826989-Rhodomonas_salina.1
MPGPGSIMAKSAKPEPRSTGPPGHALATLSSGVRVDDSAPHCVGLGAYAARDHRGTIRSQLKPFSSDSESERLSV